MQCSDTISQCSEYVLGRLSAAITKFQLSIYKIDWAIASFVFANNVWLLTPKVNYLHVQIQCLFSDSFIQILPLVRGRGGSLYVNQNEYYWVVFNLLIILSDLMQHEVPALLSFIKSSVTRWHDSVQTHSSSRLCNQQLQRGKGHKRFTATCLTSSFLSPHDATTKPDRSKALDPTMSASQQCNAPALAPLKTHVSASLQNIRLMDISKGLLRLSVYLLLHSE